MNHVDLKSAVFSATLLGLSSSAALAATMDITPVLNNSPISRVTYDVGGSTVIKTSEATGVTQTGDSSVLLKSITSGGTEMTFFNTAQAKVVNVNTGLASTPNVGVFNSGTTTSSSNTASYASAVAATSMDRNLRNYNFHDLSIPLPYPTGVDCDLLFAKALNPADFLVVSERWGNSSFQLLALAADGNPMAGGNLLRLGGSATNVMQGYTVHDWNTGYASASNVPDQAQALTLFSITKFFEGSGLAQQAVYGLRIFSTDGADVKFLGISNNTFDDNPDNPQVVPEPSVLWGFMIGALVLGFVRRRGRNDG